MNNNLSKIIIFVFVFVCTGCYDIKTTEEYIYDKIKIDISSCTITTEIETPVSFNGDGEYFITADCYKSRDIILNQIKNWNPLPLTNNLQLLMYGGEKTFTAISLLFAILKSRPVPFCILDEVEAALDEVNVEAFGEYVRKLKEKTQFIVITHKKKTMDFVDVLYGITMQESGVSKLVSVKLEELK